MNYDLLSRILKKDDVSVFKKYVRENKMNLNTFNGYGFPILHWTMEARAPKITRYVLKQGVNKNARGGEYGLTPLMMGAIADFEDGVCILLKAGADNTLQDKRKLSAVHFAQSDEIRQLLMVREVVTHYGCRHQIIPAGRPRALF